VLERLLGHSPFISSPDRAAIGQLDSGQITIDVRRS
jgi:hypothetical protein